MPNIGYGSDKKTRHFLPNGFKKFVVHNAKELEVLMMHNRYIYPTFIYIFTYKIYNHKLLFNSINNFNSFLPFSEHTVLKLHTMYPPVKGRRLLNVQLSWMWLLPTSQPGFAARKTNEVDSHSPFPFRFRFPFPFPPVLSFTFQC